MLKHIFLATATKADQALQKLFLQRLISPINTCRF